MQPPATVQVLLQRATRLSGCTLAQLASQCGVPVPSNLHHAKGWIGQLIEQCLGTTAGNKAEPDFVHLGIELKTIPVDESGKPYESTYVCQVPLLNNQHVSWQQSVVYKKLQCVLWMPILATEALAQRRLGTPILWRPGPTALARLRQDWEELMDMVVLGQLENITARHGQILQIRPKAANSRALRSGTNAQGQIIQTLPRGFYLRIAFTRQILQAYAMS